MNQASLKEGVVTPNGAPRREMGRFQLHRQKGAKNAKKEESESSREQNVKRLCKKEWQSVGNSA